MPDRNDCGEYFPKPLCIEDVIFSAAESIQKKNMVTASFVLHKYRLFQLEINGWLLLKFNVMILEHIADILTFKFRADIS